MPHLLQVWPSIVKRVKSSPLTLLFFDFDGTLSPIAPTPDLARLPDETRELLNNLNQQSRYLAGVISGRGLDDVSQRVGIEGLVYGGNHGMEIKGHGLDFTHPDAVNLKEIQGRVFQALEERLRSLPGVIVEHKGLTLSVHYRLTPEEQTHRLESYFADVILPFQQAGIVKITPGKKVLDVRPNIEWDKGKAIARIKTAFPEAQLILFFGDDLTDEDGFKVVQEGNGIAVFVGPARQPTRALHRLDSPEEVTQTLRHLVSI